MTEAGALETATTDARTAYRDLSLYESHVRLDGDSWHVDFVLRDRDANGGGPHYVISRTTGVILAKRYEQ